MDYINREQRVFSEYMFSIISLKIHNIFREHKTTPILASTGEHVMFTSIGIRRWVTAGSAASRVTQLVLGHVSLLDLTFRRSCGK